MTRDDIIRMAREAGFDEMETHLRTTYVSTPSDIERFAALVSVAEREACAKVCDKEAERALWNWHNDLIANQGFWNGAEGLVSGCAAAIRARSNA
jgi:hypothetical protein